ncbi:GNAT family N-acetyltransferase [Paenibacillus silvae]|nr:GNAT family N-acetyltransferase [Paenibacillus silvae]MCK6147837.1 GNAT family N-acetyltransferase [Paenibacillus silvae]MCK6266135.1 GNAT family N-acetyltransferase [Paenibacillus silvae]
MLLKDPLVLTNPSIELKDAYLRFYQEWKQSGEDMVPWVIEKDPENFEDMITWLNHNKQGKNTNGFVANSTYWLIANDIVVGAVNIRHELTDKLFHSGGHIGYGIRPSERRKGYAAELLKLALLECKKLGISKVLVVCDEINEASKKTIIKNGGLRDKDFIEEDGNVLNRFWIET